MYDIFQTPSFMVLQTLLCFILRRNLSTFICLFLFSKQVLLDEKHKEETDHDETNKVTRQYAFVEFDDSVQSIPISGHLARCFFRAFYRAFRQH